jgi:hypothetical protein
VVSLATLPDLVLHNVFEYVNSKCDLVCISYTSKRLHHIANRFLYRSLSNYEEKKDLLRRGLLANPANIQYIRYYQSYDPESLQEIWSVASTRLQELLVVWPPECSLSSIVQCLAAKHTEFILRDLMLANVDSWDYLLLSFALSFTNLASVYIDVEWLHDPPTTQTVVDILNCSPLKSLGIFGVSGWRLDIGEKLPKLEYLRINANDAPEDFDDDCWHQLCALMNRSIRYDWSFSGPFGLYEEVLAYAEREHLEPNPLVHWLARGQMSNKIDPVINFSGIDTPRYLITALSSIADMEDIKMEIHLYPDYVDEVFRLIPKSAKSLIFTSEHQVSPTLFLEFLRSLSKLEDLKIFTFILEDSHIVWPAGYFTNASTFSSNRQYTPLFMRAQYQRNHEPIWVFHRHDVPLIKK